MDVNLSELFAGVLGCLAKGQLGDDGASIPTDECRFVRLTRVIRGLGLFSNADCAAAVFEQPSFLHSGTRAWFWFRGSSPMTWTQLVTAHCTAAHLDSNSAPS